MTNPFDQFDAVPAALPTAVAPSGAPSNPFDQFDPPPPAAAQGELSDAEVFGGSPAAPSSAPPASPAAGMQTNGSQITYDAAAGVGRNPDGSVAFIGNPDNWTTGDDGVVHMDKATTTDPADIAKWLAAHPEDPSLATGSDPAAAPMSAASLASGVRSLAGPPPGMGLPQIGGTEIDPWPGILSHFRLKGDTAGAPDALAAPVAGLLRGLGGLADSIAPSAGGPGIGRLSMGKYGTIDLLPKMSDLTDAMGGDYAPTTTTGRYLKTVGEFAPNAVAPGGAAEGVALKLPAIVRAGARVAVPAVTSQGAQDLAARLNLPPLVQQGAGALGALLGGAGSSHAFDGVRSPSEILTPGEQGAGDALHSAAANFDENLSDYRPTLSSGTLPPLVGSHALYQRAESVANSAGPGRPIIQAAAKGKLETIPGRVIGAVRDTLGVDPRSANGDIDAMVEKGQADAQPLFDKALADPTPVWSTRLENLTRRPVVKAAMKTAYRNLINEGHNPEAEGLFDMESPMPSNGSPAPAGVDASAPAPAAPVQRAAAPASQGPSLIPWLAKNGGLQDEGGEISAMGGDLWHRGAPFRPKLIQGNGMSLETAAQKAQDAGYLGKTFDEDGYHTVAGEADILDALRHELRGNPIYSSPASDTGATPFDPVEQAYRASDGMSDINPEDYYQDTPQPTSEPVPMVQPTARAWDAVRRSLNGQISRDPITKRPLPESVAPENRGAVQSYRDLTSELAGDRNGQGGALPPEYRQGLDVSSDYLGKSDAFNRARGTLFNGPVDEFHDLWGSLRTLGEQDAARAGLAHDILDVFNRGTGNLAGKFKAPGVREKLSTAFGAKADAFIGQMEGLAQERNDLTGLTDNSKTAYRQSLQQSDKDAAEAAAGGNGLTRAADMAHTGAAIFTPHMWPTLALKGLAGLSKSGSSKSPYSDAEVNLALGRALSDPGSTLDLLDRMEAARRSNADAAVSRARALRQSPMLALPALYGVNGGQQQPSQ